MFTLAIVTISDKGSMGLREDKSGPLIQELLEPKGFQVLHTCVIPDDRKKIADTLVDLCDRLEANVVLTTGGTGFSPRDVTPEATLDVVERLTPGLPEAMRAASMSITPKAMLSRAAAGIRGKTLIINLPGSPKAVREHLEVLLQALPHGLDIMLSRDGECGG